jgi:predicted acyltransferase
MSSNSTQPPPRVLSIDAYRGLVMLLMMAEVLRLREVAAAFPDSAVWRWIGFHTSHVEWRGLSLHDLIQPSFSFLVGVALPFSLASRLAKGQSFTRMLGHAAWRAVVLVLLGIFLRSLGKPQTNFTFVDTLTQIGLGYLPLFLLGWRDERWQWGALGAILLGYWLAFALYPLPGAGFDYFQVGVPADWPQHATGFAAHWNKNANLAWAFDRWWLNLFPAEQPFAFNAGGYATLNFIPTLGTMILGLIAGERLKKFGRSWSLTVWLLLLGAALWLAGAALDWLGLCPSVKRIWTPAWVLVSGGWCCWLLALFHAVIDLGGFAAWSFPLRVIGANSIVAYVMTHPLKQFVADVFYTHLGHEPFQIWGPAYEPLVVGAATLLVYWLILWWLYRKQIFIRV